MSDKNINSSKVIKEIRRKSHKEWRKEAKKQRRKKIRKKQAQERDMHLEIEEAQKLKDPTYLTWLVEQKALELIREEAEESLRIENNRKWLEKEKSDQERFLAEKKLNEEMEKAREEEKEKVRIEFEEKQKRIKAFKEERKRREEEAKKKIEELNVKIDDYILGICDCPEELHNIAESNPSREICPYFSKVGACRFGDHCIKNHTRPGISKILVVPNFFQHIQLEQVKKTEYGNDFDLEFDEREINTAFDDFFLDVCTEFEKIGPLKFFFVCNNYEPHLRGNVYVEFLEERNAMKANRFMQGRYYAGRRINVEFRTIPSWASAICGLAIAKKCLKGKTCNFLHIFKNPGNKYPYSYAECRMESIRQSFRQSSIRKIDGDWDDDMISINGNNQRKNWRWSESPEIDDNTTEHLSTKTCNSSDRSRRRSRSSSKRRISQTKDSSSKHRHRSRSISKRKYRSRSRVISSKHRHRSRSISPRKNSSRSRDRKYKRRSKSRSKSKISEKVDKPENNISKSDYRKRSRSKSRSRSRKKKSSKYHKKSRSRSK